MLLCLSVVSFSGLLVDSCSIQGSFSSVHS
jgi:hypothetical protein